MKATEILTKEHEIIPRVISVPVLSGEYQV
jgi:hypothetical protein